MADHVDAVAAGLEAAAREHARASGVPVAAVIREALTRHLGADRVAAHRPPAPELPAEYAALLAALTADHHPAGTRDRA